MMFVLQHNVGFLFYSRGISILLLVLSILDWTIVLLEGIPFLADIPLFLDLTGVLELKH